MPGTASVGHDVAAHWLAGLAAVRLHLTANGG
jgi:hypothetical protein